MKSTEIKNYLMKSFIINKYKKQFLIAVKNNLIYNNKYVIFIKPNIRC